MANEVISLHALERFAERFPHLNNVYQLLEDSVLFVEVKSSKTEMRLNIEHNIVFVIALTEKGRFVTTVLTKDMAFGHASLNKTMCKMPHLQIDPKTNVIGESLKKAQNAGATKPIDPVVKKKLIDLARNNVPEYNYKCPSITERKDINEKLKVQFDVSRHALEKYYWPEILRLIYEYNKTKRPEIMVQDEGN